MFAFKNNLTPFRYPGAKNKLLSILFPYITKTLNDKNIFCDAFVGGGSIALAIAKAHPYLDIILNDKNYNIYCFWSIVCGKEPGLSSLLKLIKFIKPTVEFFNELREFQTTDKLISAYKALFFNRTTFSGIYNSGPIGGSAQKSKYTIDCRYNPEKLIGKILFINTLLQGRTNVTNLDINDFLETADDIPMYLDPPYFTAGKMLYPEYMTQDEHFKLSQKLFSRNNWVLSYDNEEILQKWYENCKIIYVVGNYCIDGQKNSWKKSKELVITKF